MLQYAAKVTELCSVKWNDQQLTRLDDNVDKKHG